ncbi:MAG: pentapeptide repeat-containing protein [Caulobacteraceae bacterium]|nr:pentapeptide repeat-containing protein [Caulobacteraceae bacterium]
MKPLTIISVIWLVLAVFGLALITVWPAHAQNAGQIARARGGASCPGCNLFQADFSNLELKDRNFAGARLRQADLSAAVMNRTSFARGDLRDLNAFGAVLGGVNFAGANLANASFVGAYLEGANFRGANLSGANFSGAEMARAVGLTEAQLAGACGDADTRLPHGLRLRPCA